MAQRFDQVRWHFGTLRNRRVGGHAIIATAEPIVGHKDDLVFCAFREMILIDRDTQPLERFKRFFVLGVVAWLLIHVGLLGVSSFSSATWVSLVCAALLLAVGLSRSHVRRPLTGQIEVDDGDG
jgi:hypothetical protein